MVNRIAEVVLRVESIDRFTLRGVERPGVGLTAQWENMGCQPECGF